MDIELLWVPMLVKVIHMLSAMNSLGAALYGSVVGTLPGACGRALALWVMGWYALAVGSGIILLPLQMTWRHAMRCPWLHLKWTAVLLLFIVLGLMALRWWKGRPLSLWQRVALWLFAILILSSVYVYKPCVLNAMRP